MAKPCCSEILVVSGPQVRRKSRLSFRTIARIPSYDIFPATIKRSLQANRIDDVTLMAKKLERTDTPELTLLPSLLCIGVVLSFG